MDDEYSEGGCQDASRIRQAQTSRVPVRWWQIVMRIMENQDEFTWESLGGLCEREHFFNSNRHK
jgi:hypothetical protein